MRVTGIIAEYDPLHNGHIYHLGKAREAGRADFIVVVMSGDFTQRGEPAVLDKWTRARIAIEAGADLVLELPYVFATSSAEYFAEGAVKILQKIGVCDSLCFGAEAHDIESLQKISALLSEEPESFKSILKDRLDAGTSFPAARQAAASFFVDNYELMSMPNNILAIEYLKALGSQGNIKPLLVHRPGTGHNENRIEDEFPCGSAIRARLRMKGIENIERYVPRVTAEFIHENKDHLVFKDDSLFFTIIRASLLMKKRDDVSDVQGCVEGLENRILKYARISESLEDLLDSVCTSRYARSTVMRLLLHIVTGMKKCDLHAADPYVRVLGAGKGGRGLLREIRKHYCYDIISSGLNRGADSDHMLAQEIAASDLYNIISHRDIFRESDFVTAPFIK